MSREIPPSYTRVPCDSGDYGPTSYDPGSFTRKPEVVVSATVTWQPWSSAPGTQFTFQGETRPTESAPDGASPAATSTLAAFGDNPYFYWDNTPSGDATPVEAYQPGQPPSIPTSTGQHGRHRATRKRDPDTPLLRQGGPLPELAALASLGARSESPTTSLFATPTATLPLQTAQHTPISERPSPRHRAPGEPSTPPGINLARSTRGETPTPPWINGLPAERPTTSLPVSPEAEAEAEPRPIMYWVPGYPPNVFLEVAPDGRAYLVEYEPPVDASPFQQMPHNHPATWLTARRIPLTPADLAAPGEHAAQDRVTAFMFCYTPPSGVSLTRKGPIAARRANRKQPPEQEPTRRRTALSRTLGYLSLVLPRRRRRQSGPAFS